jgi:1-acyl-sn-glycerol-3-phosphate acyltransferase
MLILFWKQDMGMRSRLYSIITVPVFAILYFYTAVGIIIVLILALFKMKRPIIFMIKYWAKSVFFIVGNKFSIHGRENIRNEENYILIANHASLFDIVAIVTFYPGIGWFGHERLLKVPLFNQFLKVMDYVPFKEPNYRNTKKMVDQLILKSQNNSVAIFPEGTRTLNGQINTFYRGFIYLYRTRDLKILPVTLNGFYDLKPKNRKSINFSSKLDVIIHEPIPEEALSGKTDDEIIEKVKGIIKSAYYK